MRLLFYALLSTLALCSCNIINPDEQEPAYVQVEGYSVNTSAGQGTASDKITEMWVNANDNMASIAEVGAQIPVLNQGPTKISVLAGIKNNGASDTRIFYPFFQKFDTVIDLQPLTYHKIKPVFRYSTAAVIDATRDFESSNNFLTENGNQGDFVVINDPQIAFEGNRCAKACLTGNQTYLLFKDQNEFEVTSGNTVFLEMNYSCNQAFTIGVISTEGSTEYSNDMVNMNATASGNDISWNKIYIDLGPVGLQYPSAVAHNLYVKCQKTGTDSPVIYLDNLKIVSW